MTCTVPGCDRAATARGMCMSHYKRHIVRGNPLPTTPEPKVGDPSGFGTYGVMERHETLALCHECGGWYQSVGSHAYAVHDMTAAQYRTEHGLKRTQPLTSLALSRARSELAQARVGSAGWQRLEAVRDPHAAAAARTPESFSAPAAREARAERGIDGRLLLQRPHMERVCPVCGDAYRSARRVCSEECLKRMRAESLSRGRPAPITEVDAERLRRATGAALDDLVRELQARRVSSASIGRALGRSPGWMSAHHPRKDAKNRPPAT